MRESKLLTREFIPWFGLPQRRPYIHVVEALTKNIASGNHTLIPLSTKKLAHKGEGVSTSPVKGCRHCSTPSRRVDDVPASHQLLQGAGAPKYLLVHSKTSQKAQHLALTLSKELILALTLTKFVLSLKIWSICTWVGLKVFFNLYRVSLASSNSKMAGGCHIYSPQTRSSRL